MSAPIDLKLRATTIDSLPSDYVAYSSRRLGIAALGVGSVHLLYLVLYRTVWAESAHWVGMAAGAAGVVGSLIVAGYLLSANRPSTRVAPLAAAYDVFLCLVLSMAEAWGMPYDRPSGQVPWTAVAIVLFPFLIPGSTRTILVTSLASASTVPLAMALRFAAKGEPWPGAAITWSFVLPPVLCALLAWAPTSAIQRLGAAVQRARRLGNYELGERLGQGGMGEVWRANHRLLARPAAVKLINPDVLGAKDPASRAALVRRFEKEAQATASLESVHTVELYDFGVSAEGVLFYVMELLHGLDLQDLVERFGPQPSERVVHLLLQACDSLEDAHARGLVHRDIKPANLFIARKGGVCDFLKVLDFGLVKRWHSDHDVALGDTLTDDLTNLQSLQTGFGQVVGTPAFLAPETSLGEQAIDGRADLYALGCVAYWLLTGVLVFEQSSPIALAVAHVTERPVAPSQRIDKPIDSKLEEVVMMCLDKDRTRRPSSAAALRELLAAIPVSEPWTRERASAWWREHVPG